MKALSITWQVLVSLVEAAVILAMFHIAISPFEMIVVSALVLIYLKVISSFTFLGHGLLEKGIQDLDRFIIIAKSNHLNTEIYEEALKMNQEELQKEQVGFWIGCTSSYLI